AVDAGHAAPIREILVGVGRIAAGRVLPAPVVSPLVRGHARRAGKLVPADRAGRADVTHPGHAAGVVRVHYPVPGATVAGIDAGGVDLAQDGPPGRAVTLQRRLRVGAVGLPYHAVVSREWVHLHR